MRRRRRRRRRRELADGEATRVLERLRMLPVMLVATSDLIDVAWSLRDRFGTADALYGALALRAQEPLLTLDRRFARAARAHGIAVVGSG